MSKTSSKLGRLSSIFLIVSKNIIFLIQLSTSYQIDIIEFVRELGAKTLRKKQPLFLHCGLPLLDRL